MTGKSFDICQLVLCQFIEFLSRQHESYLTILPTLKKLCTQLHLEPHIALLAARSLLRASFDAPANSTSKNGSSNGSKGADGTNGANSSNNGAAEEGIDAMEVEGGGALSIASWSLRSEALREQVREVLPSGAWEYMTMELYSTFWGLGLPDIDVPRAMYVQE